MLLQSTPTTSRGHYLIQELHAGSLPDLLHYRPQFLIGLLQVTCTHRNSIHTVSFKVVFSQLHTILLNISSVSSCVCLLPSVLILSAVLTRANSVALNITVPSLFRGMFIDTRRYMGENILIDQATFETKTGTFPLQTVSCQLLLAADSLLKMSSQWFDTTVTINFPLETSMSKYLKYFLCTICCQRAI